MEDEGRQTQRARPVGEERASAARRIGAFAAELSLRDIPEAVRRVARDCLVDTLGVALAGSTRPVVRRLRDLARATYAPGSSTLLGCRDGGLTAPGAALVNGAAAHVLDFDDNCYAGFVHGSAVIVPAVLAAAEMRDASGADLLVAFVAGCEAEFAVGAAATPLLYEKGWWTTGVLGPIGAAVAVAKVIGADAATIANALGLAVAGTGGAKACFGTDGKPALCGRAAEAGVSCALMANAGLTGPAHVFEDARGFARLFNDNVFETEAFDRLGGDWHLLDPGIDIKRVPVCLSAHAALDAVMDIMAEHGLAAGEIERVVCDVGPVVTANLVHSRPRTPQEGQFSLPFAIGSMLAYGDVTLVHLDSAVLDDQALQEAMGRVAMITTARWNDLETARRYPEGAHVTVVARDGRTFKRFNGMARGTTKRPLSAAEIADKFRRCAIEVVGEAETQRLLAQLRVVESLPTVKSLFASAV